MAKPAAQADAGFVMPAACDRAVTMPRRMKSAFCVPRGWALRPQCERRERPPTRHRRFVFGGRVGQDVDRLRGPTPRALLEECVE
eukprot:6625546-Prymnesium_polylepis.1